MRSKLSPLLPEEADPAPHGLAAMVSGQECLSLYFLHTVGARSICPGLTRYAARPGWDPAPPGITSRASAMVAALFQFLQVWNVSVYHQCQLNFRTSSSERPAGVCGGTQGGATGASHTRGPQPPSRSAMLESPTPAQATLGLGMEQPCGSRPPGAPWALVVLCPGFPASSSAQYEEKQQFLFRSAALSFCVLDHIGLHLT